MDVEQIRKNAVVISCVVFILGFYISDYFICWAICLTWQAYFTARKAKPLY